MNKTNGATISRNYELFCHMANEHGLTLIDSEMHEIELIVARMLTNDRGCETERCAGSELGGALC